MAIATVPQLWLPDRSKVLAPVAPAPAWTVAPIAPLQLPAFVLDTELKLELVTVTLVSTATAAKISRFGPVVVMELTVAVVPMELDGLVDVASIGLEVSAPEMRVAQVTDWEVAPVQERLQLAGSPAALVITL
jgi:hypothetical protein